MARDIYKGSYAYLGGHPAAPMPYFPIWRNAQVKVWNGGIVYSRGLWGLGFTYKPLLNLTSEEIVSVRSETGQEKGLTNVLYGSDWHVVVTCRSNDKQNEVRFRARPFLATLRQKHALQFESAVNSIIQRQPGEHS